MLRSETRLARAGSYAVLRCIELFSIKSSALVLITHNALTLVFGTHFYAAMQGELPQILGLFFEQVVLLRAKDGTWSSDSDPTDKEGGWKLEMLHGIAPYEGACAPQTCLTMHS